MNIIADKELALRFKNNAVPSRERYFYLIFSLCFFLFFSPLSYIFSTYFSFPKWDNVEITFAGTWAFVGGYPSSGRMLALLGSLITILGIIICYRSNNSGDNKEFIERYICIGIPTRIRLSLIVAPVMIVSILLFYLFKKFDVLPSGLDDLALMPAVIVWLLYLIYLGVFYWRLNSLIKIAAH